MQNPSDLKIGIVGNCYFDEVYILERFPQPDDKVTAIDLKVNLGGSATNTAVGLAKLGIKPILISAIGNDKSGNLIYDELTIRNIDPSYLIKTDGQTGRTIILLDEKKTSTKIGFPGASAKLIHGLENSDVMDIEFDLIHLASVDLETASFIAKHANYRFLTLDFGARTLQASDDEINAFLPKLNIAFLNRNVFHRLYPNSKLEVQDLKELELPCNIVLTAGPKGMFSKVNGEVFYQGIYDVEVVDTTGAGDAAASAILWGTLLEKKWDDILKIASALAAIKIGTYGASNGHPTMEQINTFLENRE